MNENLTSIPKSLAKRGKLDSGVFHKLDLTERLFHSTDFIGMDLRGTFFNKTVFLGCTFLNSSLLQQVAAATMAMKLAR